MVWNPFQRKTTAVLGIDIGTSSVKIVEIRRSGRDLVLTNYGELISEASGHAIHSASIKILDTQVSDIIKQILANARIKTKDAVIAVPLFSSFSTIIELPQIPEEELDQAVRYEARKYIPVPLAEVILDWLPLEFLSNEKKRKILVVAVPKDIIDKYEKIVDLSGLNLKGIELETFSTARALIGEKSEPTIILDIGARSTNISIAEKGTVGIHHNMDTSGLELSRRLARGLGLEFGRAEEIKKQRGLEANTDALDLLSPILSSIFSEIKRVIQDYKQRGGSQPTSIMLTGGSASLKGLVAYTEKTMGVKTSVGNPFENMLYPPLLREILKESGPSFSVATGLALRIHIP